LENRGIEPLPNLDFKFVTANSLIGLPSRQIIDKDGLKRGLFEDDEGIENLKELRDMFFSASGPERGQLKLQFVQAQNKMLQRLNNVVRGGQADLTTKLSTWDPFSHNASAWFDPEWMFGVKDDFDIVIANPPYISTENVQLPLKSEYKRVYEKIQAPRIDVYCYFYYRGLELSKPKTGLLTYITSNKWMRAGYGVKLRGYFAEKNPLKLLDFEGFKVFESATVDTDIILIKNTVNKQRLEACHFENDYQKGDELADYFTKNKVELVNLSSNSWFIGNSSEIALKDKIQAIGIPLKEWDIKINYGIKTGINEAFIIDQETYGRLVAEDPKSEEILKPILRGRDIKRYGYEWAGLWVIIVKYGFAKDLVEYPAIFAHLKQYEKKLRERGQCNSSRSGKTQSGAIGETGQHHSGLVNSVSEKKEGDISFW